MEEKDSQEDFDEATMAMLCANLPSNALSTSTPDPRLQKAWQDSTRTNQVTPILKEELRLRILTKRLKKGEPEIDTSSEEPKNYELTEEEKRKKDRRKEQNRRAAKKCREKRKMKTLSEAEKSEMLRKKKQQLRDDVLKLQYVREQLQKYVEEHITPGQCFYVQKVCDTQTYHAVTQNPTQPSLPDSSSTQEREMCSRKRAYPFGEEASVGYSTVAPSVMESDNSFGVEATENFQDGIQGLPAESLLQTGADLHPSYFSSDFLNSNGGGLVPNVISSDVQDRTISSQSHSLGNSQMLSTQQPFFLDQCQGHEDFGSSSFGECYRDRLPDSASAGDQECIDEHGVRFLNSCGPSLDADSSTLDNFTNFMWNNSSDYQLDIGEPQQFMHVSPLTPSSPSPPPFPLTPSTPNPLSMFISAGTPAPDTQEKGQPARPVLRRASSAVSVPSPYAGMQLTSSISPPPSVPSPASHGLPESPPILHGFAPLDDGRYFAHFSDTSIMGGDLEATLRMTDLSEDGFGGAR